ncbi:MAG: hypothetical protein IRZ00_00860 [Gemmatimonadetes bacterium]|nr:hypothetical protein [Gemmatimonadota bacterium]
MPHRFLRTILATAASALGLLAALPALVLTLPFWLVSGLTRWLARRLEPPYLAWNEVFAFDPEFGWKPKPNLDTHHLVDDVFRITTDADGWRGELSVADSRIVVIGDSFAWGHGVDDRHYFANLRPELRVKAVGCNGYSMVQELLWLERLAPVLQGKLVAWLIYYGNDLCENLMPHMHGYRRPFLREAPDGEGWVIESSHVSPERWSLVWWAGGVAGESGPSLEEVYAPSYQARRIYSACAHLIREGRRICGEVGATLVVMGIPDPMIQLEPDGGERLAAKAGYRGTLQMEYPDRQLTEICGALGVKFVPLRRYMDRTHFKATDCHWNERGHARLAAILAEVHAETLRSGVRDDGRRARPEPEHASRAEAGRVMRMSR